jgi:hypothetical protein
MGRRIMGWEGNGNSEKVGDCVGKGGEKGRCGIGRERAGN